MCSSCCLCLQSLDAGALERASNALHTHLDGFTSTLASTQPRLQHLAREHSGMQASVEPDEQALRLQLQLLSELQAAAEAAMDAKNMEQLMLSVS